MNKISNHSEFLTSIQKQILDLINKEDINKQSIIADRLNITQGHVSRTFKRLNIRKDEETGYFVLPNEIRINESTQLLMTLTKNIKIRLVNYDNHFVIKTSSHRPRDIASAIKEMFPNQILGTVIDDNIIVIYPTNPSECTDIFKKIKKVLPS